MAAQAGKDVLIKIGDGGSPSETFTTIAGIRSSSISIDGTLADVTNQGSTGRWRELLAGTGQKTCQISGSGVFTDAAVDATLVAASIAQTISNYQFVVPGFGTLAGAFHLSSYEYAGEHEGEVTFSATWTSAGAVAFTAA